MRKGEIILHKCDCCGNEYQHSVKYWRKYAYPKNGSCWHSTCRSCENNNLISENIKTDNDIKLYKCFTCGEWLPAEYFDLSGYNYNVYRDRLDRRCHKCKIEQNRLARANYSDEKRLIKILQERWLGARDRAKRKNVLFNITKQDLMDLWNKQKGKCAISGISMTYTMDTGRNPYNVSVDQINPSSGYTKDNIQLVCMCVNQLKSDFDMSIILNICENILKNNKHEKTR